MNAVKAKNRQFLEWNKQNLDKTSDSVCLYFHDPSFYSEDKIRKSFAELRAYYAAKNKESQISINKILCVFNGEKASTTIEP